VTAYAPAPTAPTKVRRPTRRSRVVGLLATALLALTMCHQSETSPCDATNFVTWRYLPLPARKVYEGGLRSQGTISISGSVSVEGAGIDGDASPPGCV